MAQGAAITHAGIFPLTIGLQLQQQIQELPTTIRETGFLLAISSSFATIFQRNKGDLRRFFSPGVLSYNPPRLSGRK